MSVMFKTSISPKDQLLPETAKLLKKRLQALKTAASQRKRGASVLGMFVLFWSSSEDVIGLSVCTPDLWVEFLPLSVS